MPFAGWIITKNGSRFVTVFGITLFTALVTLIPHMSAVIALMMLFLGMGVGNGLLDVAMNAQAVKVEQAYKRPIMTSFHALFSIGMAFGAWAGAAFTELHINLSSHLIVIAAFSFALIFWMKSHLVFDQPDESSSAGGPLFRFPDASMISIGIIAFCCMLGEGSMADWSVNYMENVAMATKSFAPLGLGAFATAMTVGRIFGDKARAVFGDRRMIIMGGLIATAGLIAALTFPTPYVSVAGFFLMGIGLSTIVPIVYSLAGNVSSLSPGVGLAMVTTVGYTGFLIGPPLIGFLADWKTLRTGLSVVAILLMVMTFLGVLHKRK
jgi:MFS family permease